MEIQIDDLWHAEVQQLTNEPGCYTYKVYKQDREVLSGAWDSDMPTLFGASALDNLKIYLVKLIRAFTDATRELRTIKQVLDGFGDCAAIRCSDLALLELRPQSWGWTLSNTSGTSYVIIKGARAIVSFYFEDRVPVFLLVRVVGDDISLELTDSTTG